MSEGRRRVLLKHRETGEVQDFGVVSANTSNYDRLIDGLVRKVDFEKWELIEKEEK